MLSPTTPTWDLSDQIPHFSSCDTSLGMMLVGGTLDLTSIIIQPLKSMRMWEILSTMRISCHPRSLSIRASTVKRYSEERWFHPIRNGIPREMRDSLTTVLKATRLCPWKSWDRLLKNKEKVEKHIKVAIFISKTSWVQATSSADIQCSFLEQKILKQLRECLQSYRLTQPRQVPVLIHQQDIIEVPTFYHQQWAPEYSEFVNFRYDGTIYQIRLRQHRAKVYFAEGLKEFRKDLSIYESVIIKFLACNSKSMFDLYFVPSLECQTCGRPEVMSRQHIWTLEITQSILGGPGPLRLSNCAMTHVNACGQHMTILRRFGPPLQWNVVVVDGGVGRRYVVQP
ncbi:hypothetical protein JHK87_009842 [Glycine soja]|nr:hypothetical protein JHK87_009842 [Glycine soja]